MVGLISVWVAFSLLGVFALCFIDFFIRWDRSWIVGKLADHAQQVFDFLVEDEEPAEKTNNKRVKQCLNQ